MAISYVGTTQTTDNSPDSGSWTLHANWQPGDCAIFWWFAVRSSASLDSVAGEGITEKFETSGTESGAGTLFVGYRELQSGDTTFDWTGSTAASVDVLWGVDIFRGVDMSGDPFEASSGVGATTQADTNDPDPPAATPVSDDAAVWTIFGKGNDYSSIDVMADYTLAANLSTTAGADGSVGSAYRILSGGASVAQDPGAWTLGGGISTDDCLVWTAILAPASAGGDKLLSGAAVGVATVTGSVVRDRARSGTATGALSATGAVVRDRARSGTVTGVLSATGSVVTTTDKLLSGAVAGVLTATGALVRDRSLPGTVTGRLVATGIVTGATLLAVSRARFPILVLMKLLRRL